MKFYGIEMKGKFTLQKVSALPSFDVSRDEGRLVYNEEDDNIYYGSGAEGKKPETEIDVLLQPINDAPANNATEVLLYPELITTGYYSLYNTDQQASEWQVASDSEFNTLVVNETKGAVHAYTLEYQLSTETQYFWRVRFQDVNNNWSEGSDPTSFTTANIYTESPTLTVEGAPDSVPEEPWLSATAFNTVGGSDTHEETEGEIVRTSDSVVVWTQTETAV